MSKSSPKHPGYVKMKDTPWIKQAKEIGQAGGEGYLKNYNDVNVFNQNTLDSLNARNNDVYQRAFSDMNKNYNDIMNRYAGANYNRFGTLNATAPSYAVDEYQKDFQRQMNDLSYNKAVNYENLVNNELQRRYNTLNMLANMYNVGSTGYQHDKMNWNVENTNRDIDFKNQQLASSGNLLGNTLATIGTIGQVAGNISPYFKTAQTVGNVIGGMQ